MNITTEFEQVVVASTLTTITVTLTEQERKWLDEALRVSRGYFDDKNRQPEGHFINKIYQALY